MVIRTGRQSIARFRLSGTLDLSVTDRWNLFLQTEGFIGNDRDILGTVFGQDVGLRETHVQGTIGLTYKFPTPIGGSDDRRAVHRHRRHRRSGDTTQAAKLHDALRAKGLPVHLTREPSDGPVGVLIRQILSGRVVVPGVHGARPRTGRRWRCSSRRIASITSRPRSFRT